MNMESSEQFESLRRAAVGSFKLDLRRYETLLASCTRVFAARGEALKGCWGRQSSAVEALGEVVDMDALVEWNRAQVPACLDAWRQQFSADVQAFQGLQAECGAVLREQALEWGRGTAEALEIGATEFPALQAWADWYRSVLDQGVEAVERLDGLMGAIKAQQLSAQVLPVDMPVRRNAPRRKAA